jgi:hypothetical protein
MIISHKVPIPLQGNERLYEKYNLLNKYGKVKEVSPNTKTKKWVKTLNLSPYYHFRLRLCTDGKCRIFVYSL